MVDFIGIMTKKTRHVRCRKCGKEIEIPNLALEKTRKEVLSPFCCAYTLFTVQWLVHHGWHVRDLGLTDSHPYFCPDCWEDGTPEYEKRDYGEVWCKQAQAWMNNK